MDHDRKVISWRALIVVAVLMIAVFGVLMYKSHQERQALLAQEAALLQTLTGMELDYNDLYDELARVGTEGYVENEARENYGFIKAGEICFAFTNPQKLQDYTAEEWQVIMEEKLYIK